MKTLWLAYVVVLGGIAHADKTNDAWTSHPLTRVKGTVDGVAFTLLVPEGLSSKKDSDSVELTYETRDENRQLDPSAPLVHVTWDPSPPKTLTEAASQARYKDEHGLAMDDELVVRKRVDRGFSVLVRNKAGDSWHANVVRIKGKSKLACQAGSTTFLTGGTLDDRTGTLLEKICDSLAIE